MKHSRSINTQTLYLTAIFSIWNQTNTAKEIQLYTKERDYIWTIKRQFASFEEAINDHVAVIINHTNFLRCDWMYVPHDRNSFLLSVASKLTVKKHSEVLLVCNEYCSVSINVSQKLPKQFSDSNVCFIKGSRFWKDEIVCL